MNRLKQFPIFMLLPFLQSCFHFGNPKLLWHAPIASQTTPIVYNGTVYVEGFHAGHPGEPHRLFALDAGTGKEKWVSADSVKEVYGESGGSVFLNNMAGHLVQLDAKTGEKLYETEGEDVAIKNWVLQGDIMYIVNGAQEVVAVDNRQNKVLWRMKLPFKKGDDTALALAGKHLIVSGNFRDFDNQFGMIWALDPATGKEIWHFETPPPKTFAPLVVLVHDPYVLATNTSPLQLETHVLDILTGKALYPPIVAFDFRGCYESTAFASSGAFDLKTGKPTGDNPAWATFDFIHNGIAWQRRYGATGLLKSFTLRTTYDGDYTGTRDWTNTPPNTALEGFEVKTGKSKYTTKEYQYTGFSAPVEANGVMYHSSIAMMKEGKSGVWAYRLK